MKPLRVAVLMETSLEVSRQILSGIARYAKTHGPWILEHVSGGIADQRLPDGWRGDGIIARIASETEARKIAANPAPKIIFDRHSPFAEPAHPLSELPSVECDNEAIGRMAARHFLERKFEHFAFIGPSTSSLVVNFGSWRDKPNWSERRSAGYARELEAHGHAVHFYGGAKSMKASANWMLESPDVGKWLQSLPKPVAIFAPHDARARQVADACLQDGIPVPYSVAILGVNNDRTLCETSLPPLSSISLDAERAGYTAAKLLNDQMHGRSVPSLTRYAPLEIAARDSTLPHQTKDALVIEVLEKIRMAHGFNLRVGELAAEAGVTARTLEKRFSAALGRSVGDVVRTSCLVGVRELVTGTDLPFSEIAVRCGQRSAAHLADVFRRRYGKTMTEMRNSAK